jgi:hypothetical protein
VEGSSFASTYAIIFSTAGVPAPLNPVVLGTNIAEGATNVAVNASITVNFSKAMNTGVTEAAIGISPPATMGFGWSPDFTQVTITFTPDLAASTAYNLTVGAGATDTDGLSMVGPFNLNFTTGAGPDVTSPTVVTFTPSNGATSQGPYQTITIQFSEPMDTVATEPAITITPSTAHAPNNVAISLTYSWNAPTNDTVTINPITNENWLFARSHTIAVGSGAKDVAGNALSGAPVTSGFTTRTAILGDFPFTGRITEDQFEDFPLSPPSGFAYHVTLTGVAPAEDADLYIYDFTPADVLEDLSGMCWPGLLANNDEACVVPLFGANLVVRVDGQYLSASATTAYTINVVQSDGSGSNAQNAIAYQRNVSGIVNNSVPGVSGRYFVFKSGGTTPPNPSHNIDLTNFTEDLGSNIYFGEDVTLSDVPSTCDFNGAGVDETCTWDDSIGGYSYIVEIFSFFGQPDPSFDLEIYQ